MANPHAVDPDSEDASNIMRVISVKNSCADKQVIVQLIRFNNKVCDHTANQPRKQYMYNNVKENKNVKNVFWL